MWSKWFSSKPESQQKLLRVAEGRSVATMPVYDNAKLAGWSTTDKDDWALLWSYYSPWHQAVTQRRLKRWRLSEQTIAEPVSFAVNHLPSTLSLTSKEHLVQFTDSLPKTFSVGVIPKSYLLPEQVHELTLLASAQQWLSL